MRIARDGSLIKDQTAPTREITEVGQTFISVKTGPEEEENLLLIPDDARPMLNAIRGVLMGDERAVAKDFRMQLSSEGGAWRIVLVPKADSDYLITVTGCDDSLLSMEIREPDGVERILTFDRS